MSVKPKVYLTTSYLLDRDQLLLGKNPKYQMNSLGNNSDVLCNPGQALYCASVSLSVKWVLHNCTISIRPSFWHDLKKQWHFCGRVLNYCTAMRVHTLGSFQEVPNWDMPPGSCPVLLVFFTHPPLPPRMAWVQILALLLLGSVL